MPTSVTRLSPREVSALVVVVVVFVVVVKSVVGKGQMDALVNALINSSTIYFCS